MHNHRIFFQDFQGFQTFWQQHQQSSHIVAPRSFWHHLHWVSYVWPRTGHNFLQTLRYQYHKHINFSKKIAIKITQPIFSSNLTLNKIKSEIFLEKKKGGMARLTREEQILSTENEARLWWDGGVERRESRSASWRTTRGVIEKNVSFFVSSSFARFC